MSETIETHYRACHLCEAICGIEIKTEGDRILSIRGDKDDPFSQGHICPKATAIQDLHEDPDRLKKPVKNVDGAWVEISWEEAISTTARRLCEVQEQHGGNSVAFFAGNPGVHNYGLMTHGGMLRKAVGTRNHYSATSLDQLPHMLASLLLYGHQFMVPVPDIDHTNLMVIMGGNPLASNGSMMTVPNVRKRLKAIQERSGKVIVIDPRRNETAAVADTHHFIRPGSDAFLLMAIINTLFEENLVQQTHLTPLLAGVDQVQVAASGFSPERAEAQTGILAADIRGLARDLASTEGAVLYGRMGVSTQEFGGLCQWAIQVINILAGNLDARGGAIVPTPAVGNVTAGERSAGHFAKSHSRVSGLPNFGGEFPAAAFAEEILTPGEGQIKGVVTIATNPAISAPQSDDMDKALESLDFMVALDFYINETTRHADIILPPTSALEHDNYDIAFNRLAVRNVARFNEPVFEPEAGARHDWQIINELAAAIGEIKGTPVKEQPAPEHIIDLGLQYGPYGRSDGLDLAELRKHPHGLDLGPLQPGLPDRLGPGAGIDLATPVMIADMERLAASGKPLEDGEYHLIGRRHVRSNNSWMHNSHRLTKGPARWHLLMHPGDMEKRQIRSGDTVRIASPAGEVTTTVSASDEIMEGVVSLPHGWGHRKSGVQLSIASEQDGVNCNILTEARRIDAVSGNAALNGSRVRVEVLHSSI